MIRRFILFGFGAFISIVFLSMGPENRLKTTFYAYIDYFNIDKRVINHLITDSTIISENVECLLLEYEISKIQMLSVLNGGEVNFEKSNNKKNPCQIFVIENQDKLNYFEVTFEYCDIEEKVTVIDLSKIGDRRYCLK